MFCGHMDKNYVLNCLVEKNNTSKAKLGEMASVN